MLARITPVILCLAGVAHAQSSGTGTGTGTTPTASTGMCTGDIMGTISLSIRNPSSSTGFDSIASTFVPYVFGDAECQCPNNDFAARVQLTTVSKVPPGQPAQMWAGTSCNLAVNRTTATQQLCENITAGSGLGTDTFASNASHPNPFIDLPVQAAPLFSPIVHTCSNPTSNNHLFILLGNTGVDTTTLCDLPLNEVTIAGGPTAASNVGAGSGDSAINVTWDQPPATNSVQPRSFQVLCADLDGNPIPGVGTHTPVYSVCLADGMGGRVLKRRALPTADNSTGIPTTSNDGGVTTAVDLGTASQPLVAHRAEPQLVNDAGMEVDDMGNVIATDGGITPTSELKMGFEGNDPAFLCSDELRSSGTSYNVRISGLQNGTPYQFKVVSIDLYGNAVPSDTVVGVPKAAEDLYRRFRDDGGNASGFCFIATAAFGSYEDRYVKVLRDFRDQVLLPTSMGHAFVDWYYDHSPPAADYIAQHKAARIGTQILLWPVIGLAALVVYTSAWQKALLVTLLVAFFLRKRVRKMVARA
jgi:hypothetical protein